MGDDLVLHIVVFKVSRYAVKRGLPLLRRHLSRPQPLPVALVGPFLRWIEEEATLGDLIGTGR